MKFEEVLPALKKGKKIRRTSWWEGHYFRLASDRILDQGGRNIVFSKDDLFCSDWEVIDKKKKVKIRDLTIKQYNKWIKNNCDTFGDYCDGCPFQKVRCDNYEKRNDWWIVNKDLYSDKFLDQEVEVEE